MTQKFGVPTDEQLAKINKLAKRTLSVDEVFTYPHKMAGDMIIPERHVQLTRPLLDVFVNNSNAGVAFLLNHSWTWSSPKPALPYGRIFEGELSQKGLVEGETISFNGTAYFVRGQEKDGISTDSIISDIETGVLFDTSIGWGANKFECSICGNDIRDWRKCEHIPGRSYIVNEDTGEIKLCWAMAKPPGYLMEDSGVFDGAYPGAGTSLSMLATEGGLENEQGTFIVVDDFKKMPISTIFGTYSNKGGILTFIKKADYKKVYSLSSGNDQSLKGGGKPMNEKMKKMLEAFGIATEATGETGFDIGKAFEMVAEKYDAHIQAIKDSIAPLAQSEPAPEPFMTAEQAKEKLGKELNADEVLSLAKEGQDYHKKLSDEALAMGVRAMGNDFPKETWEKTFANMASKDILSITATWETQAKDGIPAGRLTNAGAGLGTEASFAPDEAYKVGK